MSGASDHLARKITSAKDLSSVVRSMKALAATSLGQYEHASVALQECYSAVELSLSVCLRALSAPSQRQDLAEPRSLGVILIGSDQGLVGRFNEVLLEFALDVLQRTPATITRVWVVGERMQQVAADSSLPPGVLLPIPYSIEAITPLVGQLIIAADAELSHRSIGGVHVFHHQPLRGGSYKAVSKRLLPLDALWQREMAVHPWPARALPEVLGGAAAAIDALVRNYLFIVLFQACAEALASENASRLAAMQRAEENIATVLNSLTQQFHRVRQASIDEELFEVVSGYDALGAPDRRAARHPVGGPSFNTISDSSPSQSACFAVVSK